MSIILSSTTDTPEQVQAALEHFGYAAEEVKDPDAGESQPRETETPAPPAEPKEPAADGKTAAESETAESNQESEEDEEDEETDEEAATAGEQLHSAPRSKRSRRYQRRIEKLIGERARLEGELEALKRQLAEKQPQPKPEEKTEPAGEHTQPQESQPGSETASGRPKPKLEDFESYEEFVEALTDWKAEEKAAALRAELRAAEERQTAEARQAEERRPLVDRWNERAAKLREQYADFDEVTSNEASAKLEVTAVMAGACFESEVGPDIAYYLGKHPEETRAIAKLPPVRQAAAIGRIEERLLASAKRPTSQPSEPAPKKTPETPRPKPSSAPAPIEPVGGGKAGAASEYRDDMTQAEFREWRKRHPRG